MKQKVAVVECPDYNEENVKVAIEQLLKNLDLDLNIYCAQDILIKPNLLMGAKPEQAITTHPIVVGQVLEQFLSAQSNVIVGDSSGYGNPKEGLFELTGMQKISEKYQIPVVDLGNTDTYDFKTPYGVGELPITQYVKDRYVISIPKAKTSRGVLLTCGVKNVFGCVAGDAKNRLHTYSQNADVFYKTLISICKEVAPTLTIVDAIDIMEGNGPDGGTPAHLGLMFAGTDPFAVDMVVAMSLGLNPEAIGLLRYEMQENPDRFKDIEIIGVLKDTFPRFKPKLPRILSGNILGWGNARIQ